MIDKNYFIINVLMLTAGTILIRGCFIFLSGKMNISSKIKDLFTYIPAAILPGLIIPSTFFHQGNLTIVGGKERFIVLLLAIGVTFIVRNTLFTIVFGLTALYLSSFV